MRILALTLAACLMLASPAFSDNHLEPTPPIEEDALCGNGPRVGFCEFVIGSLIVFAVLDWLVPLNRADADPARCRGQGSVIKAPSPWGTSNCGPSPIGSDRQ